MIKTVFPPKSLNGVLTLPADKSISQRAAIFSLLYKGESVIGNYSHAHDPQSSLACVQQLGARVVKNGQKLIITGVGRDGIKTPENDVDCGNSGTAMRLLSGVIAGAGIPARLVGDASLSSRTMTRIIDPLTMMGADFIARENTYAPLSISRSKPLTPLRFELPIPSAQLKSCILLAGLFGEEQTVVIEKIPSRDHTERLLGLTVSQADHKRIISASQDDEIPAQNYKIPGDFSSAAFWLVAGAIHPDARLELKNVGLNPTRNAALHILQKMGCDIRVSGERQEGPEPVGKLTVQSSQLKPVEINPELIPNCIDELPVLSVAMLFADGVSTISGAAELRHKETDRIHAIAQMLKAVGASYQEKEDGLVIHGDPGFTFKGASFQSFHDHRIAMASAVLALKGKNESNIEDAESAEVSYQGFWDDLISVVNA